MDSFMKYLLPAFLALALVGCGDNKKANQDTQSSTESSTAVATSEPTSSVEASSVAAAEVVIKYQDKNKKTYELKSLDNFETATLTDSEGKTYALKEAMAGSGMRLEGQDGIYIHTKGEQGTLELVKNQPIDITEVK